MEMGEFRDEGVERVGLGIFKVGGLDLDPTSPPGSSVLQ